MQATHEGVTMKTIVMCKQDNGELSAGVPYTVLDARAWGYRLQVGKVPAWYDKEHFLCPTKVPDGE